MYVKRLGTGEIVKTIAVSGQNPERVLRGLLRQMDTEKYYVDDTECYPGGGNGIHLPATIPPLGEE